MLFTVYDPAGEPFEVRPELAKKLVIDCGWSLEPPVLLTASPEANFIAPVDHLADTAFTE